MSEVWVDIKRYKGFYQVSLHGRVRSLPRMVRHWQGGMLRLPGRMMALSQNRRYVRVMLTKKGNRQEWSVHRLVAGAFITNPKKYPEVNHKDGDKCNNHSDNLEWATRSMNAQHAVDMGLMCGLPGEANPLAKLTSVQVVSIKKRLAQGERGRAIAKSLKVSESLISMIKHGTIWSHTV